MSDSIRAQIYETLNLKETDELRSIWIANNRTEYTDQAFDVIQEILGQRLGAAWSQDEPEVSRNTDGIGELAEISGGNIDRPDEPAYYKPQSVMTISAWLKRISVIQIPVNVLIAFVTFNNSNQIINSFWLSNPNPPNTFILTLIYLAIIVGLQCFITLFALRSLAFVLEILMEMEFNSRKV